MSDVLAPLVDLPGVAQACDLARSSVDAVLWDRAIRARAAEVAGQSRLRGAWATAAIDGAEVRPDALLSGDALDGSPMGNVVGAALAMQAEIPRSVDTFSRAPLQVLSHLHAVAATDFQTEDDRGRLRTNDEVDDPLRLPDLPPPNDASARLAALARILTTGTAAPALVVAGIAHAEVATIRPFTWGSGMVARAMTRLVLASRGVDPDGLTVSEAGLFAAGRSRYISALRAYQSATPDGLAQWLILHADAVRVGADESRRIFADLPSR